MNLYQPSTQKLSVKKHIPILALTIGLCAGSASAQNESPAKENNAGSNEKIEELTRQVQQLTESVKTLQDKVRRQQQLWEGFHAPLAVAEGPSDGKSVVTGAGTSTMRELQQEVEELKSAQRQHRTGMFNPDISAAVDFITSYSRAARNVNFTMRDVEFLVQSNIDTFARAYIVLNAGTELDPMSKTDVFGDVSFGVEEAAIATTSLPYGLVLKGGEFFADFTRMAKVHPHDRPFVDGPSSVDTVIGGEAKARGLELSWLPPVGHYFRLTGGVVDNIGAEGPFTGKLSLLNGDEGSAFADRLNRPFKSLMLYGRGATLFELGRGAVLHLGADYAQSSQRTKRQIASGDVKLEWQPDPAKYDMFEVGGEVLWTRESGRLSDDAFFGGNPFATSKASGGYAYAQYRFGKQWEPGIRIDYTHPQSFEQLDLDGDGTADALHRRTDKIWTYSAYLNFWASELNRLRLQVNYVDSDHELGFGRKNDWQIFLQWTAIMGAHKHEFMP